MNLKLWVIVNYLGVRILGEDASITDITEAMALSYESEKVDIYSNSWGPEDGHSYTTFGRVSESALIDGVTLVSLAAAIWLLSSLITELSRNQV